MYDIEEAFAAIEEELISSMIRNFDRHRAWEEEEEMEWEQWQALQLRSLEQYKKRNKKRFTKQFDKINKQIEIAIREARDRGGFEQELKILEAIKQGKFTPSRKKGANAEFFKINDRKIEALIKATVNDMQKAETAILRMANDQYRQVIYNAQVYANSGAGTYEKAVDMATKDFLSSGLNCVEYKNGARHTLKDYADMALRTASKRAYLTGEGEKRAEWGIHTVIINKRGNPCPKCLPFVGRVFIDDVWSGGSAKDGKYPLLSSAVEAGLYHPRCKDSHTTFFPGITPKPVTYNKAELKQLEDKYINEQKQKIAVNNVSKYKRLAKYSLDPENKSIYKRKAAKANEIKELPVRVGDMGKDEFEQWVQNYYDVTNGKVNLTATELKALDDYGEGSYELLNAYGRYGADSDKFKVVLKKYGNPDVESVKQQFRDVQSALDKFELDENIVVHRAVRDISYMTDDISVEGLKNLKGKVITEDGFASTSFTYQSKFTGQNKNAVHMEIVVPKGSNGAYIDKFVAKNEKEFLLGTGTKYKIVDGGERTVKAVKYDFKKRDFVEVEEVERFLKVEVLPSGAKADNVIDKAEEIKAAVSKKGFIPAQTVEEAEEYAKQFVKEKTWSGNGNVSYKGLSLESANKFNETLLNLYEQNDIPLLNNIQPMNFRQTIWKGSETTPMAYRSAGDGDLFFNPKIMKNAKSLDAYMEEGRKAFKTCAENIDKFKGTDRELIETYLKAGSSLVAETTDDAMKTIIEHEMGHHIQNSIIYNNEEMAKIVADGFEEYGVKISGYATKTKGEYIAESYAAFCNGKAELIDPKLKDIFENIRKTGRN